MKEALKKALSVAKTQEWYKGSEDEREAYSSLLDASKPKQKKTAKPKKEKK